MGSDDGNTGLLGESIRDRADSRTRATPRRPGLDDCGPGLSLDGVVVLIGVWVHDQ